MDGLRARTVRHRLGVAFELWSDRRTWFWSVADPHRNGHVTIGAAAGQAAAIRDACSMIEELAEELTAPRRAAEPIAPPAPAWEASLAKLGRYLSRECGARAYARTEG